ncbi:MAG TPA: ABC transporter permease, partial [Polyangiaceae bacterium LLY-WYZ-14_1]|nr:ABC transporter permease [Polyangiaceae bacterium LLY-WYZ-14_1]
MGNTLTIARRQFAAYFNSPTAYIVLSVLLLFVGFFFWEAFFLVGRATIRDMYSLMTWSLFIAAPALTMGLIAEEKKTGTIELLLTMPVRDGEVIVGKFLGALGLYAVLLLLTLPYPISVASLGDLDWGQVASGYFGLLLLGAAMLSVGLAASSWTDNQLVALFVGAFLCLIFVLVDRVLPLLPTGAASVLEWLSFDFHLRPMTRGVIDTRDVFY